MHLSTIRKSSLTAGYIVSDASVHYNVKHFNIVHSRFDETSHSVTLPPIQKCIAFSARARVCVCVCVCVCVLLWPCTQWVWAVTMRQLCTFCSIPSASVQKPTMSPARPMPYSMLNKGNAKKVIHYCIRQAVQLVEASRPQGMSGVVRFLIGSALAEARM